MIEDKLSRISALRPVTSPAARQITPSDRMQQAARLLDILGAEHCTNRLGCHIRVRQKHSGPPMLKPDPRLLRLLAPQATEEAADPSNWIFLDTETTGLAGGTGTYAFLVGVAWWDADGLTIEQLFMRNHSEEASLLLELGRILEGRRVLVTFNGKSFDWPLLETRFRMTRAAEIIQFPLHLDLLHPARRLWRWMLKSVALSELEHHVLHLDRGYDIPSETIPARYFEFLRGGPPEPIAEVFRHNEMDLKGLAALAVHILKRLEAPALDGSNAAELLGISRLLEQRGELPLAGELFERALSGELPPEGKRLARRQLAMMAKRRCNFGQAESLWRELLGHSNEGIQAFEELAKLYEHRLRHPQDAAAWTRQALSTLREALHAGQINPQQYRRWHARFQHRLDRLVTKIG